MTTLFDELSFLHGPSMKNRFMLAPLTNQQSHADGILSDEEFRWLTMRAQGGFGITMTCASHVMANGQGFPGQLGCFGDEHLEGLTRLAHAIRQEGSLALLQLHHAGRRAPKELIGGNPVAPWDDEETGATALTTAQVEELIQAVVDAAVRCERAGFDGVEIHGAHDYVVCEFLNGELNHRDDRYGGSLENRARVLLEILRGIRAACRPDFHVAVRLSPEMFGMRITEIVEVFGMLVATNQVDLIDMSLWNVFNVSADPAYEGRTLLDVFTSLPRGGTRLAVAGKIYTAAEARTCLEAGADVVALGRAAITNHDFPLQTAQNPEFAMRTLPVPRQTLADEGLSETFLNYMSGWKGFVGE